ncbi:MAG: ATP-binding protein [Candidatus Methanoperedens sp.]
MPEKTIFEKSKKNWIIVLIICLLSVAVIISLGFRSYEESRSIVMEQFSERQLLLSKQISSGMNEFLNEKTTLIEIMALHVSGATPDVIMDEFTEVYNKTDGVYVFEFINETGVVTMGFPVENTPLGYDLYRSIRPDDSETEEILKDTFESVRDKKETKITRPVRLLEGGLGAFVWTPVYKGDEFKGLILAIISIPDISDKFMKNYDLPWNILMIDDRGTILYDSSGKYIEGIISMEALDISDLLNVDQMIGKEGTGNYLDSNASKMLLAYSPIAWRNQNWSIAVITPESEIDSLINSVYVKQSLFIEAAIGFIMLGSILIIFLLSRWNKALELEVAKKTCELNESNSLLQDANTKLTELDKLKSDFLSMVSHELKTPLTAMRASSELLMEDGSKMDARKDIIQILIRNIDRLTRLVNNLLDTSMIESGQSKYTKEVMELRDIIEAAVGTMKTQYEKKGLKITIEVPEDLPRINADKDRIIQVFVNLLSNALKFSHDGGNVEIRACESGNHIEVQVKDDGIGIHPDKIDKIFDKFYQVNNKSTRPYDGSGLGLTITRGIMEAHGGSIRAKNAPSGGSVFILTFNI